MSCLLIYVIEEIRKERELPNLTKCKIHRSKENMYSQVLESKNKGRMLKAVRN